MLIETIPATDLLNVCEKWKRGDSLQELIGGQLFGVVEAINLDASEEIYLITNSTLLEDCALMLWLAKQLSNTNTVGCFWSGDYQSGVVALHKGQFTEFSFSSEVLLELQKQLMLNQIDNAEIDDLREQGLSEEEILRTIEEWSEEYRVEARDGLQQEFLRSVHDESHNFTNYPYFKLLSQLKCAWNICDLPNMAHSAGDLLLEINYSDPKCVESIFKRKDGEFWKQHRNRVRGLLKHLPAELKDSKDLFKRIISYVAAWPLEYAGSEVRTDKEIIRLAVKADKAQGYSPSALKYATMEILQDEAFIKEILLEQPNEFYNLPENLKEKRDFLKIALKAGLFFSEVKIDDRELLEIYVSSGDTWVYSRIPEAAKNDPNLAKIYLQNGGEWDSIPKEFHSNQSIFECYLVNFDFDSGNSSSAYKLKIALENHLAVNDWQSSPVSMSFLDACLQKQPRFLSMLRYDQLEPHEWLTIAKNYDISEYGSRPLKLRLALELKKQFGYTDLFYKVSEMPLDNNRNADLNVLLIEIATKMLELELSIAEASGEG